MSSTAQPHIYTRGEETANALTHAAGVLLALPGAILLVCRAAPFGAGAQLAVGVYGAALVFMLLASAVYHSVRAPAWKARFRKLDHAAIYLLIAGTYTPVLLLAVNNTAGNIILTMIWSFAVIGLVFKVFFTGRFEKLSIALYLLTGWSGMLILPTLLRELSTVTLVFILAGGVIYSLGVIFYARKHAFAHAGWHLFVLGGAFSQYLGVWFIFPGS